jgi:putative ABC transport system substrate-binding protein
MKRRALTGFLAYAAVAPSSVTAQQRPLPVIGWLNSGASERTAPFLDAFRQGLADNGFVDGRNVAIEQRWAGNRNDRLPALAAELVGLKVDVIVTGASGASARAAKAATSTIPIVFGTGDPVASGLVSNLSRPGGNLTGVGYLVGDLTLKRFDLMLQAVPRAKVVGMIVNPGNVYTPLIVPRMQEAARQRNVELLLVQAGDEGEVDAAFPALVQGKAAALIVQADPYLNSRRAQLRVLTTRHMLPASYTWRDDAEEGDGLMSYGPKLTGVYRQLGTYAARLLKGAKPADLPVVQPTTFELVINQRIAKALNLSLPPAILAQADEVIE